MPKAPGGSGQGNGGKEKVFQRVKRMPETNLVPACPVSSCEHSRQQGGQMRDWPEVCEHYREHYKAAVKVNGEYVCPYYDDEDVKCERTFTKLANLRQHMTRHYDVRSYECPEHNCSRVEFCPSTLDKHRRAKHGYRSQKELRAAASSDASSAGGITPALSDASTFPESPAPSTPATLPDDSDKLLPSSTQAPDTALASGVLRDNTVVPSSTPRPLIPAPFTHIPTAAHMHAVKTASAVQEASEIAHGAWIEALCSPNTQAAALAMLHAQDAQAPVHHVPTVPRLPAREPRTRRAASAQDTRFAPYDVTLAQSLRAKQARVLAPAPAVMPRPITLPSAVPMPTPTHWAQDFQQVHVDDPYFCLEPAFGQGGAGNGIEEQVRFWYDVARGASDKDMPAPYAAPPPDPEGPTFPVPVPYTPADPNPSGTSSSSVGMPSSSMCNNTPPTQQYYAYPDFHTGAPSTLPDAAALQNGADAAAGCNDASERWCQDQAMGVPPGQIGLDIQQLLDPQQQPVAALGEPSAEFDDLLQFFVGD